MEIIPAILPTDFQEIEDKLSLVRGVSRIIQIDVCDGLYVPSKTWPYSKDGNIFDAIVSQDKGMPFWEDFDFEFDLMVKNPYERIQDYVSIGAKRVIVHLKSADEDELRAIMNDFGKRSEALAPFNIELGLAIGSREDVSLLEPYINDISFIQVMGIQNVGFQRQGFDEECLETVQNVRGRFPEIVISVDGGVSENTAIHLANAGADRLVVGSALFGSSNIIDTIEMLRNI
jgi:ribulose-phosphate 3-epimerase